jgi:hypothetical protein
LKSLRELCGSRPLLLGGKQKILTAECAKKSRKVREEIQTEPLLGFPAALTAPAIAPKIKFLDSGDALGLKATKS